jgi:hypothetical protein
MRALLLAALLALPPWLHRLYQKVDPDVAQGNALAAQNDPEGALREYDKARERLGDNPALLLNRAGALLKMDAAKAPEAASEAARALQRADAALKPQAAYDLALATEAMGKPDEAMIGYRMALGFDPEDRDSKVNLELLLKTQEERKQKQQMGEQKPNKQQQEGKEDKQKKQGDQQQQKDEKKQEQAGQQQGQKEQEKLQEKKKAQAAEEKPVDRSEAERLLDALRAGEKNLQVWRFAKDKRKEARRSEPEKDW